MVYLSAGVVLVGALGVFNLLLSLGLIRQWRAQGGTRGRISRAPVVMTLAAGERVGGFTAATTAGRMVSRESLNQVTLVGFFSTSCPSCRKRVPEFLSYAAGFPGDVLAVAVGEADEEIGDLAGRLSAADYVVVEAASGALGSAFGVGGYPALCVMDPQGRIVASGTAISDLPTPVPA